MCTSMNTDQPELDLLPRSISDALEALGERIALTRRYRNLTQVDLARQVGIGLSTLVAIERGQTTVQIGFWLRTLQALDLLEHFDAGILGFAGCRRRRTDGDVRDASPPAHAG